VALQLRKMGIKRVRPLAGGFYGWRDKGYPLTEFYREAEKQASSAQSSGSAAG